jgi:hypothetical protein
MAVPSKSGAKEIVKNEEISQSKACGAGLPRLLQRFASPVWIQAEKYALPLRRFLTVYFMINKTSLFRRQKPVIQVGKNPATDTEINQANSKVNRANAQSRPSGILFAPANGKLYFELLISFCAAQNNLPPSPKAEGRTHSEVARPKEYFRYEKGRQSICINC